MSHPVPFRVRGGRQICLRVKILVDADYQICCKSDGGLKFVFFVRVVTLALKDQ